MKPSKIHVSGDAVGCGVVWSSPTQDQCTSQSRSEAEYRSRVARGMCQGGFIFATDHELHELWKRETESHHARGAARVAANPSGTARW